MSRIALGLFAVAAAIAAAARREPEQRRGHASLDRLRKDRRDRRRPPEAGMPVPAIPPRGPLPMQGGAEAPLDFSAD